MSPLIGSVPHSRFSVGSLVLMLLWFDSSSLGSDKWNLMSCSPPHPHQLDFWWLTSETVSPVSCVSCVSHPLVSIYGYFPVLVKFDYDFVQLCVLIYLCILVAVCLVLSGLLVTPSVSVCQSCLALPCLALPCLALPCLALPCLALFILKTVILSYIHVPPRCVHRDRDCLYFSFMRGWSCGSCFSSTVK